MLNIFDLKYMDFLLNKHKIADLRKIISEARQITVVSHTNPDGDAIGSGIAWTLFLNKMGAKARFFVPNHYPDFLGWLEGIGMANIFCGEEHAAYIAESDVIFCVDFNVIGRLERLGEAIEGNTSAKKVLIDHHLSPPDIYDLQFSETASSSTSYLCFSLIEALGETAKIDHPIAEALYVGIMTDTGNFSFSNLTPKLFRAVATLVECGINPPRINTAVYNTMSEHRLRMVGYMISEKLIVNAEKHSAYMTLTRAEKTRFNHQIGDTEGIVNYPLTIKGIDFSALFIETKDHIKISLRSRGDFDVNLFAREHFSGGGHKNAAGGKFFGTMAEAVAKIEKLISER